MGRARRQENNQEMGQSSSPNSPCEPSCPWPVGLGTAGPGSVFTQGQTSKLLAHGPSAVYPQSSRGVPRSTPTHHLSLARHDLEGWLKYPFLVNLTELLCRGVQGLSRPLTQLSSQLGSFRISPPPSTVPTLVSVLLQGGPFP